VRGTPFRSGRSHSLSTLGLIRLSRALARFACNEQRETFKGRAADDRVSRAGSDNVRIPRVHPSGVGVVVVVGALALKPVSPPFFPGWTPGMLARSLLTLV